MLTKIVNGEVVELNAEEQSQILAGWAASEKAVNADYKALRATAYPPVGDGLDAMVKGGQAWEDYKAACLAVKAKYPKV